VYTLKLFLASPTPISLELTEEEKDSVSNVLLDDKALIRWERGSEVLCIRREHLRGWVLLSRVENPKTKVMFIIDNTFVVLSLKGDLDPTVEESRDGAMLWKLENHVVWVRKDAFVGFYSQPTTRTKDEK